MDTGVWADKDDPDLSDVIGPHLKWGGITSMPTASAPVDPARTTTSAATAATRCLSMTVYGGSRRRPLQRPDRRHSTTGNSEFDADGNFVHREP